MKKWFFLLTIAAVFQFSLTSVSGDSGSILIVGPDSSAWGSLLWNMGFSVKVEQAGALFEQDLSKHDAVIVLNWAVSEELTSDEAGIIGSYVEGGGHFIIFAGQPFAMAGGRHTSKLEWLGANFYEYGEIEERVLDAEHFLTSHFDKDTFARQEGSKAYLGRVTTGRILVGTERNAVVLVNEHGNGRVLYLSFGRLSLYEDNPDWRKLLKNAILLSGIEITPEPAARKRGGLDAGFVPPRASNESFACIVYGGEGNIDLKEGTFEVWAKIGFEPSREVKFAAYWPALFFSVFPVAGGHRQLIFGYIYAYSEVKQDSPILQRAAPQPSLARELRFYGIPTARNFVDIAELGFEKGGWYHIAAVWGRDRLGRRAYSRIYVNGELKGESGEGKSVTSVADSSELQIVLGRRNYSTSFITLDSMRISSVARTEEELKASFREGLKRDDKTFLFDSFDNVADGELVPAGGGEITGAYELVDTKFGRGVKMHAVEEQ